MFFVISHVCKINNRRICAYKHMSKNRVGFCKKQIAFINAWNGIRRSPYSSRKIWLKSAIFTEITAFLRYGIRPCIYKLNVSIYFEQFYNALSSSTNEIHMACIMLDSSSQQHSGTVVITPVWSIKACSLWRVKINKRVVCHVNFSW